MIRVTIELIPHGIEERKSHLGTIIIANDGTSATPTRGNYLARLSMKGRPSSVWRRATVKDFARLRQGAYDLLFRVLRDAVGGRNP